MVVTVAVSAASFATAYAANPVLEDRPFWVGTPYGGTYPECVGMGVYAQNYGYMPAGTTYGETKYSNGGYCNNWLQRPANWVSVVGDSKFSNGLVCATSTKSNSSNTNNVWATAGTCSGAMKFHYGEVRYNHPTLNPDPYHQMEADR